MATIAVRQTVEVIFQGENIHFINAGSCLQCNETEEYLTENGTHMATIRPGKDGITYVNVDTHVPAPAPVDAIKRPCYCDTAYHPQGC